MSKHFRCYVADAFINLWAQLFLLFPFSLIFLFGSVAAIAWVLIAVFYSVLLAKMMHGCIKKKGGNFRHYALCVMLPPNIIAAVIGTILCIYGSNVPHLAANLISGLLIIAGSIGITAVSILYYKMVLCQKEA